MRIKVSSTLPMRCRSRRKAIIHDVVGAFTTSSIRVHNKCSLFFFSSATYTCITFCYLLVSSAYARTHRFIRLLLSSPAEGGGEGEEERSGIARGELLLRCDCDYPLLLLCAHHFFVGLLRVSDEVLFLQLGMRRREDERGQWH